MGAMIKQQSFLKLFFCTALLLLSACSARNQSIAPGLVPRQDGVSIEDEQYGQQVASQLADKYTLSSDDYASARVEKITTALSKAARADASPWNVYIFDDDTVVNAAATRGNFIFVWTGMLNEIKNQDELAAILAHEMSHVLAGHTADDPDEEVNRMIAGVTKEIVSQIVSQTRVGPLADLAGQLVAETIEAMTNNPESQRRELEADQIGIFIMADAKFDPRAAVDFWGRARFSETLSGGDLGFFSTHPSSDERYQRLQDLIPEAMERYRRSAATRVVGTSKKRK